MEQGIRRVLEGGGGIGGACLRGALSPLGWLYGRGQALRRWAYGKGVIRSFAAEQPVISVGNLSAGGVGKTPMVAWLVERLLASGRKPAVLLRGYRARGGRAAEADEAQWYAARFPGVPVVANRDRVAGAATAAVSGADVLVLDDGFQHLRLKRDFDLVVLDASVHGPAILRTCHSDQGCPTPQRVIDAAGWFGQRCLPAGLLREDPGTLACADAFVLTRVDQAGEVASEALRGWLDCRWPGKPVCSSRHAPTRLTGLSGDAVDGGPAALKGQRVLAVAGIGRPEAFAATLAALGATVTRTLAFPDHHAYSGQDAVVLRLAAATDAARLVTTEKDAVKLRAVLPSEFSAVGMWVLGVSLVVDERPWWTDGEELFREIARRAAKRRL